MKLNILVPVKRVIDFAVKPRISKAGNAIEKTGVKFSINPFCDIAVEEAVRIREQNKSVVDKIHVVSIGPSKAQDILRQSLAKGCDSSTLVEIGDKEELEPLAVAKILKKLVEQQASNLVILGKQSIDDDSNNTGQMLAGMLGWPQATNAAKVALDTGSDSVSVTREIDGGEETLKLKLPAIITTDLRLNEPRYVTLPNVMKAKKKPLAKLKLADVSSDPQSELQNRLKVIGIAEPAKRPAGTKLSSVDELIAKMAL